MNQAVRISLYVVLATCTIVFGLLFFPTYKQVMKTGPEPAPPEAIETTEEQVPTEAVRPPSRRVGSMMTYGVLGGISFLGLALLLARDVSKFLGHRAAGLIQGDEEATKNDPDYEVAEQAWSSGKFLEAIQLMRDYHNKNPREIHTCLRIAEIYEKDLGNHLAAALEYEEVIKHKLPPERWGWAAIHLANLYTGKLNKPDQAIELLKRIVNEFGSTAAARKARERLIAQGIMTEAPPSSSEDQSNLPPGFSLKK